MFLVVYIVYKRKLLYCVLSGFQSNTYSKMMSTNSSKPTTKKKNIAGHTYNIMAVLLIYGYITNIEKLISKTRKIITPESIIILCLKFYAIPQRLIYYLHQGPNGPFQIYAANMDYTNHKWKNWECNIYNLDSNTSKNDQFNDQRKTFQDI